MAHVLVVDDDEDNRGALRDVLELRGYAVSEAANGRLALEHMLSVEEPSLVILDLEMPIMTGAELVGIMKRDPRLAAIPVVILSGSSKSDLPVEHDVVGFLEKPCNARALLELVRKTLRDRSE
jgi:CheY-like chemotaxis protein